MLKQVNKIYNIWLEIHTNSSGKEKETIFFLYFSSTAGTDDSCRAINSGPLGMGDKKKGTSTVPPLPISETKNFFKKIVNTFVLWFIG